MTIVRFPDSASKRRALGLLAGRFPFKSWATGEMAVPEPALGYLAEHDVRFSVEGQASYERLISAVRDPASSQV